jgi:hypothetical protein
MSKTRLETGGWTQTEWTVDDMLREALAGIQPAFWRFETKRQNATAQAEEKA